eukprot:2013452-Lingulodinium_polyedra.AAC.1
MGVGSVDGLSFQARHLLACVQAEGESGEAPAEDPSPLSRGERQRDLLPFPLVAVQEAVEKLVRKYPGWSMDAALA